jgi:hypothetical protein
MARFVPVTVTPERLAELDEEHDGVHHFAGPEAAPFCYVIRRPTARELSAYTEAVKRGSALDANRKLLKAITVYPEAADYDRQVERWPGSPGGCLTSTGFAEFSGAVIGGHQK